MPIIKKNTNLSTPIYTYEYLGISCILTQPFCYLSLLSFLKENFEQPEQFQVILTKPLYQVILLAPIVII